MIEKKLKYATFSYNEESKEFSIKTKPHGESETGYAVGANTIKLNKIYAFAFMRFVIRISQKNWLKGKKVLDKKGDSVVLLEELQIEDPNQMTFEELSDEESMGVQS